MYVYVCMYAEETQLRGQTPSHLNRSLNFSPRAQLCMYMSAVYVTGPYIGATPIRIGKKQ